MLLQNIILLLKIQCMELVQFLIWLTVVWLVTFLILWFSLQLVQFKQPGARKGILQLALVLSIFVALIFGLAAKPFITYNHCSTYNIKYSIFTLPVLKCDQALWLILLLSYLASYITLYLILFNMHAGAL